MECPDRCNTVASNHGRNPQIVTAKCPLQDLDLEEIRNSLLDNYLGDSKRVLYAAARSARMKFLDSTSQARE